MSLVQMGIGSVAISKGPTPSLVILHPMRHEEAFSEALPINIGSYEATAISMGFSETAAPRPMTHDLLSSAIKELDGRVEEIRITDVRDTTFFAQVVLIDSEGAVHYVDARPSDAIALAVRAHAPIYAERDVLQRASYPNFMAVKRDQEEQELADFHSFVEELSPEDFDLE